MRSRYAFLIVALGLLASAGWAQQQLNELWRVNATERDWMTSTSQHDVRSVAYNPVTDHISVVSRDVTRNTTYSLTLINPATGADISSTPLTAAGGGWFEVNKHGVTSDGITYVCNMTRNWSIDAFTIYRMASETGAMTIAYRAISTQLGTTLDTARVGDSFAVNGSGTQTKIYVGTRAAAGPHVLVFGTIDGVNFTIQSSITLAGTYASSPCYGGLAAIYDDPIVAVGTLLWVKASGQNAFRAGNTGAIGDTIDSTLLPDVLTAIPLGLFRVGGTAYLGLAPGNYTTAAQERAYFVSLPATGSKALIAQTGSLKTTVLPGVTNGNGTGAVAFDSSRSNVIILATNNTLTAHRFDLSAAQDWQLLY